MRVNRIRKTVDGENTFFTDLTEFDAMLAEESSSHWWAEGNFRRLTKAVGHTW